VLVKSKRCESRKELKEAPGALKMGVRSLKMGGRWKGKSRDEGREHSLATRCTKGTEKTVDARER
jgi:hypothetical protein